MRILKRLTVATFAALLAGTAYAKDRVLPDACGSDNVIFDIKKETPTAAPEAPSEGKSRFVFAHRTIRVGAPYISFVSTEFTTRLGVDGSWVGAAGNNTYFTVEVPAGEHHLCVSVQGGSKAAKSMVSATPFTAEAGKTYYFDFTVERGGGNGAFYKYSFQQLNDDEGKFRAKALEVSISTPQK